MSQHQADTTQASKARMDKAFGGASSSQRIERYFTSRSHIREDATLLLRSRQLDAIRKEYKHLRILPSSEQVRSPGLVV